MMPVLITGNRRKVKQARAAFKKLNMDLQTAQIDITEIQHHDPLEITRAKAKAIFDEFQKPVLVNDSSWSIPALGGFPGGYMKDVVGWFSSDDFLILMRDKSDRRIILNDVVAYYDGSIYKTFSYIWEGVFAHTPSEKPGTSLDRCIRHKDAVLTLAEEHALDNAKEEITVVEYTGAWLECAEWLKVHISDQ